MQSVQESKAKQNKIAKVVLQELDHFQSSFKPSGGAHTFHTQLELVHEPFVAIAEAEERDGKRTRLFICRHYIPLDFEPSCQGAFYASYLSPLGRIVTKHPGETHEFEVKHRTGLVLESHAYRLTAKDEFRPSFANATWDGLDNRMAWLDGQAIVASLRQLLAGVIEEPELRHVAIKVQLPAQAILDAIQDDVFRLPFNQRIRISGAPGTGKTTVLLKRLSQKTKHEFLSDAERRLVSQVAWNEGQNWVLFTPSDLLKAYLKEALAKEMLPAGDDHVKVCGTFRLETLRDIGFIRVGQKGFFKVFGEEIELLKRPTGVEHVALTLAFREDMAQTFSEAYQNALQEFNNATREPLADLADASQKLLLTALDIVSKAGSELLELRNAQTRAAAYRDVNRRITTLLAAVREIGEQADVSPPDLLGIYTNVRRFQNLISTILSDQLGTSLAPEVAPLIDSIRGEIRKLIDSLSLRRLFELIPRSYQEFRENPEKRDRFFREDAEAHINQRIISGPEQDVILFQALEFLRQIIEELPADLSGVPDQLRVLQSKMRTIVAIDEATDFSALEIGWIERLAMPRVGGVTISGDLMQRVTRQGLRTWSDLAELSDDFHSVELKTSYRQTARLFQIARDLYRQATKQEPEFESAYPERAEDPPPLSFKSSKDHAVDVWLTDRVVEIFELCGNHLPTTAVLVPQPSDVEELYRALRQSLSEHAIQVDASDQGQSLGDSARVRIFPVEFIKGLEFEAVFYVGLDRMADIHKELIDKYLYVGLSRARSFLAVTYERQFPVRLQSIAEHFVQQNAFQAPD